MARFVAIEETLNETREPSSDQDETMSRKRTDRSAPITTASARLCLQRSRQSRDAGQR